MLPRPQLWTRLHCTVVLAQVSVDVTNAMGVPVPLHVDEGLLYPRRLVFVKVSLANVISRGSLRHHLGTVSVGDTVVPIGVQNEVFVLTSPVPYNHAWVTSKNEAEVVAVVTRALGNRTFRATTGPLAIGNTLSGPFSDTILLVRRRMLSVVGRSPAFLVVV